MKVSLELVSVLLTKVKAYHNAVQVARKHFIDWETLVFYALLGRGGTFRARKGGAVSYDAKKLLRKLVRMEKAWRLLGYVLPQLRFETDAIIIPDYFGRDFRIPWRTDSVSPPSFLLNIHYPFDVNGDVVLDIGAYLGDTPLMWLYKGAKSVIAVEPVPLHFQFLERNVAGLPVICINASLAVQLPLHPSLEGSMKYGIYILHDTKNASRLRVPIVQLTELVNTYHPTFVKLDCEGCEHYVLKQLIQLPQLGVKKLAVEFHKTGVFQHSKGLDFLRKNLGNNFKVWDMGDGVTMIYWSSPYVGEK